MSVRVFLLLEGILRPPQWQQLSLKPLKLSVFRQEMGLLGSSLRDPSKQRLKLSQWLGNHCQWMQNFVGNCSDPSGITCFVTQTLNKHYNITASFVDSGFPSAVELWRTISALHMQPLISCSLKFARFVKQYLLSVKVLVRSVAPPLPVLPSMLALFCSICAIYGSSFGGTSRQAMPQEELTPMQELQKMFGHLQPSPGSEARQLMDVEDLTEDREEESRSKYSRPSTKGLGQGKGPTLTSEAAPKEPANSSEKPANPARQDNGNGRNQEGNSQSWNGWGRQSWSHWENAQYPQRHIEELEEDIRLLARICLRHEDELSQRRPGRGFVLTFEVKAGNILNKLYAKALRWHQQKEAKEVDSSLRHVLFLEMLTIWKERMRAVEASEELKESVIQQGWAEKKEGIAELHWLYQTWNATEEKLQTNMELEPMLQNQIYETLVQLEATIVAPNALQQFHSTHKLVEQHSGETVTFLLSLGLRDVMATQAWGMLTNLCGNAAAKLIGLRIRPMRMERQPIVKVLAERFPPAPKGKGKGKNARQHQRRR